MILVKKRQDKIVYFIALFLVSIAFSFYYYGIQKGFTPNSESLASIWVAYHNVCLGEQLGNSIWTKLCEVAVLFFGLSYKSLRVVNTFMYFMITIFALDLAIRNRKWEIKWYALPIYMLFMVMMHHGNSIYYGQLTGQVYQYPFDQHMLANFSSIFCLWMVYRIDTKSKYRLLQYMLLAIIIIGCMLETDLLFCVTFVAPLLIVLLCKYIRENKIIVATISIIFIGVAVCRFLAQYFPGFSVLFVESTERYSSGYIYGATNFEEISNLLNNFLNYFGGLSGLFNFDFSGTSVINLNLIIYSVRVILVGIVFYYVCKNTKRIASTREVENVPEAIIALGIVILSFFFIFTNHGNNIIQMRYLDMLLPYGTILLCWHTEDFAKTFNLPCLSNKKIFFGLSLLCIIASHDYSWGKEKVADEWDKEYQYIAELVEEKGLHQGIAGLWTFASISAVSDGKHILNMATYNYSTKSLEMANQLKTQYFYDYILLGKDGLNAMNCDIGLIEESYGKYDEIIETEKYYLITYKNGIKQGQE